MKALLVDLDGTLVDSLPLLFGVYCDFLAAHGQQGTQAEFDELNGYSLIHGFELLQKRYQIEVDFSRIMLEMGVRLLQAYHSVDIFPGGVECLQRVRSKGICVALVTSADQRLVDACLKGRQLTHLFDEVVTLRSDEPAKPDPAIYRRALNLLGAAPEETMAIEDSSNGVAAATGAGIPTLHIIHGEGQSLEGVAAVHGWLEAERVALGQR